jgi:hypothetical protein
VVVNGGVHRAEAAPVLGLEPAEERLFAGDRPEVVERRILVAGY